jgi:isopenicillin N synthase-like dioxygenase
MPSSIPIIDLANISTSHAALKEAVETIGFFYIQNTLISNQEVEEMFAVSKDFYENESVEEKRLCAHNIDNKGYGHEEV